jgi:dipeptidyl aminopeptidase/acylaminoacyl peptidase
VTIPLVGDFAWSRDGAWLAYGVSSAKAEEDGAFARRMSDGTVTALHKGKGNYKEITFDEAGRQLAFVSDQADYDKDVSPYRLYHWKAGDAPATELVSGATRGVPQGMVVSDQGALRFSEDGQRLFLGTAPPAPAPAAEGAPDPRPVDVWHWKDPLLQPMQRVRAAAGAQPELSRRRPPRRSAVRPARHTRHADRQSRRGCEPHARHRRSDVPAGDLWISDTSFRDLKKISTVNPQQSQYVWGKAELVKYRNADGKDLRAILVKPDDFDPAKQYPLMVYIYEELSEGLHSYRAPAPGTSINVTRYVSNGYVVLMPDIVYDTGYPGESAEKCVIPAVNAVVAQGFVDPARIGIQGHSWGGYQITHLITRTNMFAAVQAGASVSDMVSAYGGIRWGTGMSRAFQYEKTQSRIGAAPWDAPLQFIENSPIFWVRKVRTPYLSIHNDEDDAVPWYQGIEFFSALRRLGKEAYMFVYNGEPHGLRNRDNMKHWTVHQDEFFDHFLLGKPKPEWMEKGVPFLEKGKRDVTEMFKPRPAPRVTTEAGR